MNKPQPSADVKLYNELRNELAIVIREMNMTQTQNFDYKLEGFHYGTAPQQLAKMESFVFERKALANRAETLMLNISELVKDGIDLEAHEYEGKLWAWQEDERILENARIAIAQDR